LNGQRGSRFGWSLLSALREGRFKVILAPRPELYDLEADPNESVNLYQQRADLASMTRRLRTLGQAAKASPASAPVDAETRARLTALGYVAASATASGKLAPNLADPKDRMDLYQQLTRLSQRQGGLP
jgi:choline-sulfatase